VLLSVRQAGITHKPFKQAKHHPYTTHPLRSTLQQWMSVAMRPFKLSLWLLLLLCLAAGSSGLTSKSRQELKRQTAKRWRHVAEISRLRARSGARHFLEERGAVSVGDG
jgi:hypothetical protein